MIMGIQSLLLGDTIKQHYESSIKDPLTGIFNRRYFFETIKTDITSNEIDAIYSIILCDIDHFKLTNDKYGHDIGDEVLKIVAQSLKNTTGEKGIVSRFGGEEFTVLVNNYGLQDAAELAETLRMSVSNICVPSDYGNIKVTASFGVAEVWDLQDIDATIKLADDALFRAKANGRNQVCIG